MSEKSLSIYWLWIPIIIAICHAVVEIFLPHHLVDAIHSENGLYEVMQVLVLLAGLIVCLLYFLRSRKKTPLLNFWFALAALCSVYVAGEEISWGQHLLEWDTPEEWAQINDQNETNLHNTSSWLDQKPRLILLLGIIVGTLIIPTLQKFNLFKLPANLETLLPPRQLTLIALMLVVFKVVEKLAETQGIMLFTRYSEVEELYMFYFVFLYLFILFQKTCNKITF